MKKSSKYLALCALISSALQIGSSRAERVLYYPFDTDNGTIVANGGTSATDGTISGGGTYGAAQDATFGTAFFGNRLTDNDAWVLTGLTGNDLGMGASGVYTAMAWVLWDGVGGTSNDHMVFGQDDLEPTGNVAQLHHGIRAEGPDANLDNIHFGGWGAGQDTPDAGTISPASWTHVAWQYDGVEKVVYVNGVETSRAAGNNISTPDLLVRVGGHTRDGTDLNPGHSFNGAIDEVKVYDEVLTTAQIMSQMVPGDDTDGDGLSDADETTIHMTDPADPDSDDDGINDGVEVGNMLDPNSAVGDDGATGDPDLDNLSNLDEITLHGTNPQVADTDGDGLNDDVEINTELTNPTAADSDGDGLDDGAEVNTHMTDPNLADTDGEGLTDGEEINTHMTDPNLEDTDEDGFSDGVEVLSNSDPNDAGSVPSADLPNPLLYYSFNVENGTVVENLGTTATAGVLQGAATYDASIDDTFGTAFFGNRTGDNDAYVQTTFTGDDLAMGSAEAYTAMAWVSWNGVSGQVDHMVFGQDDGNATGNTAQLHHGIRADGADTDARGHFGHWGNDINNAGIIPVDGTWTHMAFTWVAGSGAEVFVNGVSSGVNAGAGALNNPALPVIIGAHTRDGNDANLFHSFNGGIDEVKIYGQVLTPIQITLAMEPGSNPPADNFRILAIDHDEGNSMITLEFTSTPGESYTLSWSPDLTTGSWDEVDDGVLAGPVDPTTTFTFMTPEPIPNPGGGLPDRVFLRLSVNP